MAKHIEFDESKDDFDKILAENKNLPVFVDFNATWCGPCKALKPVIEKTCKDNGFVLVAVDVDNNPDLSEKYGVPTDTVRIDSIPPRCANMSPDEIKGELLEIHSIVKSIDARMRDFFLDMEYEKSSGDRRIDGGAR